LRLRALLVLTLLAAACRENYDAARDEALKRDLSTMRQAIAKYRADTGHYPPSLEALVPRHLAAIPADPMTKAKDWRLTTEESVQPSADFTTGTPDAPAAVVVDVHSAASGADRNGVPYTNY
jgi:general secretion pathway protein G